MNLTPFIPLSLERRGGISYIREAKPPFNSPRYGYIFYHVMGESYFFKGLRPFKPANMGGVLATFNPTNMGRFRGALAPLYLVSPSPLKGKGIKGIG
jgi:hypothetical protein